ncbi:hypothetical protein [Natrarchaeobius oligotrophus]|uniref:DUF7988 domain-containing protein n=1 Tax=Natrarchaeobius chitinivorans TaxID=1679083 RepID=A0A3N6MYI1_NATCH|nr:hypothetical protein [Natrarchaeobius chitinivorans]RQH03151.1 hypothetical protein EA472_00710 [Natrarchaeobius chitinivorans]
MSHPVRAVRRRVRDRHGAVVDGVGACADRVAATWTGDRTADGVAVSDPLRESLERDGLLERFPDVLADLVEAAGCRLRARPVPAPPYVVVTSRGPMLRATIDPGRLVVRFDVFEVARGDGTVPTATYRRRNDVRVVVSLE